MHIQKAICIVILDSTVLQFTPPKVDSNSKAKKKLPHISEVKRHNSKQKSQKSNRTSLQGTERPLPNAHTGEDWTHLVR